MRESSRSHVFHLDARVYRLGVQLVLAVLLAGLTACSDDDPSGPGSVEVVDHLEIETPGAIRPDQPFELRVVAVGSEGTRPFPGFEGEVEIRVSEGTVTPATVTIAAGEGVVTATVQTTAPSIALSVDHPAATGSIDITFARDASVTITSGRFYLNCFASASTSSMDQEVLEEREASMPQTLNFSETLSAQAEATHLTAEEVLITAFAATESDLVVTSEGSSSMGITGLSIAGGGSGVATWDGSTRSGGSATGFTGFVQIDFTVEGEAILVAIDGTFDQTSFNLKDASGIRLLDTRDLGTARLEPGDYEFRANLFNQTLSAAGGTGPVLRDFSASMELDLVFMEDVPTE